MNLTNENVINISNDCKFKIGDSIDDICVVDGIVNKITFNKACLYENKKKIESLLNELPIFFKNDSLLGGSSFLIMCKDKHGNQWTDLHQVMELLLMLGLGISKIEYLSPREKWCDLPGGMPYIAIK